jgi:hypothetical protein
MRAIRAVLAVAFALGAAPGANALSDITDYQFSVSVDGEIVANSLYDLPVHETYDPGTHTWGYVLDAPVVGDDWSINTWSSVYDVDPFVTNNITMTNNSAVAQTFIISAAIPIPAFAYDKAVFSSVGVTTTDSNGTGGVSVTSLSLFEGQVNGVGVLSLLDPVSLTQANCSPFPNTNGCTATTSDGIVLQALPAGVATVIGIKLQFTLSPGDSIGITSRFEIVPEPTTLLLVGMGVTGLAIARRRRA